MASKADLEFKLNDMDRQLKETEDAIAGVRSHSADAIRVVIPIFQMQTLMIRELKELLLDG